MKLKSELNRKQKSSIPYIAILINQYEYIDIKLQD